MMRDSVLLLLLSALWLLFTSAVAADFTGRVVAVSDSDILVAPPAVANPILDTPLRAA